MFPFRSLGCSLIELVTGFPPYSQLNAVQAISKMAEEDPPLPLESEASALCRDLLRKCVVRQTSKRATAAELLQHSWLRTAATQTELSKLVHVTMLLASLNSNNNNK